MDPAAEWLLHRLNTATIASVRYGTAFIVPLGLPFQDVQSQRAGSGRPTALRSVSTLCPGLRRRGAANEDTRAPLLVLPGAQESGRGCTVPLKFEARSECWAWQPLAPCICQMTVATAAQADTRARRRRAETSDAAPGETRISTQTFRGRRCLMLPNKMK